VTDKKKTVPNVANYSNNEVYKKYSTVFVRSNLKFKNSFGLLWVGKNPGKTPLGVTGF
jgi:hypothetical protein